MAERIDLAGCEFPENAYESTQPDGSKIVLKIVRTPRIKDEPDPSKSCGVAMQIQKGEFDPSIGGMKVCARCNTVFSIIAGIVPPPENPST